MLRKHDTGLATLKNKLSAACAEWPSAHGLISLTKGTVTTFKACCASRRGKAYIYCDQLHVWPLRSSLAKVLSQHAKLCAPSDHQEPFLASPFAELLTFPWSTNASSMSSKRVGSLLLLAFLLLATADARKGSFERQGERWLALLAGY